jgi:hypothetical protein
LNLCPPSPPHPSLSHSARAPSRPLRPSAPGPSPSRRRSRWRVKAECIGGAGCIHAGGHAPPSLPPPLCWMLSLRIFALLTYLPPKFEIRHIPFTSLPRSLFLYSRRTHRCSDDVLPNAFSFVIIFLPTFFPIRRAKDRQHLESTLTNNSPAFAVHSSSSNTFAEIQTMSADLELPAALLATTPTLRSQGQQPLPTTPLCFGSPFSIGTVLFL